MTVRLSEVDLNQAQLGEAQVGTAQPGEAQLSELADRWLCRWSLRQAAPPEVIIIDGRSGAGKSTLARDLAVRLGAEVLPLDELYPGWSGLAAGSEAAAVALETGAYRRYDWGLARYSDWVRLDSSRPLIVEGCGSLTARMLSAARGRHPGRPVATVWLACDATQRYDRAMQRDAEQFRDHWHLWRAQEDTHLRTQQPLALAAEIVHSR